MASIHAVHCRMNGLRQTCSSSPYSMSIARNMNTVTVVAEPHQPGLLTYSQLCNARLLRSKQCQSRLGCQAVAVQAQDEPCTSYGTHFPRGIYSCTMQVRDYELDQYNVVNNAIYASYLQHGRHEAFACLGHDCDSFARAGTPLALSQLNLAFKAPLRSRDHFRVDVWVAKMSAARVVMGQAIWRATPPQQAPKADSANAHSAGADSAAPAAIGSAGQSTASQPLGLQLVASAEAVVVFLDKDYRPTRIPPQVKADFEALHQLYSACQAAS